jgi:hypothetical protein
MWRRVRFCVRVLARFKKRDEKYVPARERHGNPTRHPPPWAGPTRCQRPRTSEVELCRVSAKTRQRREHDDDLEGAVAAGGLRFYVSPGGRVPIAISLSAGIDLRFDVSRRGV